MLSINQCYLDFVKKILNQRKETYKDSNKNLKVFMEISTMIRIMSFAGMMALLIGLIILQKHFRHS